jgi:hypothetical protein
MHTARARHAWMLAGLVIAVVVAGAGALTILESAVLQTIPAHQRVFTYPLQKVIVDVQSGSVTVQPSDRSDTVVESSGTRGLLRPTDDEHVVSRTLIIGSSCRPKILAEHCTRHYILRVPWKVSVVTDPDGTG